MIDRLRARLADCGRKLRPTRRGAVLMFSLAAAALMVAHPAFAGVAGSGGNDILTQIGHAIGNFALIITKFLGSLLLLATDSLLIPISSYNGFVSASAVTKGWVIIRDLTNMFFVLMMLVIAIGTILGVEEFSYRRLLPRLLIMAVLINFSKVIVGIFIDFAQVVMLTFVNGYSAAAGGNILKLFKLKEMMSDSQNIPANTALDITDYVGAQLLALLMMGIALFIVIIMCMMLAFRIVMLWVLTILSPLAFFLSTFPRGKAHSAYARWWELFGNYVVSGPLLAFFLWLAFSVTASDDIGREVSAGPSVTEAPNQYFFTEAGSTDVFSSYIVGVALLLAGMYVTADLGVAAGGMLRGGADWLKGSAQRLAKGAALLPLRGAIGGAKAVGRGAGAAGGKLVNLAEVKTGYMVPFSERAKKRRQMLRETKAADREREFMETRLVHGGQLRGIFGFGKGQKATNRLTQNAAEAKDRLGEIEARKEAMFRPANELRSREQDLEALAKSTGPLVMDVKLRTNFEAETKRLQEEIEKSQQAQALETDPGKLRSLKDEEREMTGIRNSMNRALATTKDGEEIDASDLPRLRDSLMKRSVQVFDQAENAQRMAGRRWQPQQADLDQAKRDADSRSQKAMAARQRMYNDPESRWLLSSIGKAESEAAKSLPPDMTPQDRLDFLAGAFKSGNKSQAKVLMREMASKNELADMFESGAAGGQKYGTDAAGVKQFVDMMTRRLGMSRQEANRTANDLFQTAAGKGDIVFHGKMVQDAQSGAVRVATDAANQDVQAGKLDKKKTEQLFKEDSTNAIFNITIQNDKASRTLSDAGIAKILSGQQALMGMLDKGTINSKLLGLLKEGPNMSKLDEMVKKGLLSAEFIDKLSGSTARKVGSAKEYAKRMRAG